MKKLSLIVIIFLFVTNISLGGTNDTAQLRKQIKIIDKLLNANTDSCFSLIKNNLTVCYQQKYIYGCYKSNMQMAQYYTLSGYTDSALQFIPNAIKYARIGKDTNTIVSAYLFNARLLSEKTEFNKAIDNCLMAQRFADKSKNLSLKIKVNHDLGYVYSNIGTHQKALQYYKIALKFSQQKQDTFNTANLFARIGGEFNYLSIYDSALNYNLNALKNFKLLNFKRGIGVSLSNLANTYSYLKNYDKAIKIINEAIEIRTQLGDEYAISILKNNLTECLITTKKYEQALKNAKECEQLVKKQNEFSLIVQNVSHLKIIYYYLNDYKQAYIYANRYVILKDSLFEKTNLKTLNELQTKYETDKKEKEISILQLENKNASQKAVDEKKRRNIIFLSILFFTMLIAIFTIIIFKRFKKSQKQKRIIEKQKHLVDEKQKEILDSIHYAKRIQQSLLPTEKYLERIMKNKNK